mmetsp:Transcript_156616/g.284961  ORF Transcript_156616/g.284961 Transcript_156616/m.284961 type:complete len:220 (+) Transcript_156616:673-1332(+)
MKGLHHVFREVSACQIQSLDRVRQAVALVARHHMGNTIAAVHHASCGATLRIESHHSLDDYKCGRHAELFKKHLNHPLSILPRIHGSLCDNHGVLLRVDSQLVEEGVVPNLLHVIPICHDAVLNGILEGENTTLALRLVTDIAILRIRAKQNALLPRTADKRREDASRCLVPSKACLAHATAIVNDKGGDILDLDHFVCTRTTWLFARTGSNDMNSSLS